MPAPTSSPRPGAHPAAASAEPGAGLTGQLVLHTPLGAVLTDARIRLLEAIGEVGSLNRAAKQVPLSYKAAWDALDAMNALAPQPLVVRSTGGKGGGGTQLTDYARSLIGLYRAMQSSQQGVLDRLPTLPEATPLPEMRTLVRKLSMKTSARNQFAGRVMHLSDRGGLVDVGLDLGEGDHLTATITPESAADMGLQLGTELHALIKAPWVGVRLNAPRPQPDRNALAGTVVALRTGARHIGCTLRLPSGRELHAVVLPVVASQLQPGQPAWAVFPSESVVLVSFA